MCFYFFICVRWEMRRRFAASLETGESGAGEFDNMLGKVDLLIVTKKSF